VSDSDREAALARAQAALEVLQADPEARRWVEHREMGLRLYHADLATVRDESEARGEARGRVLELVETILALVLERGLSLSDAQRQRIVSCEDVSLLRRWVVRAARVERVDDVLE
jgi:hypothetical protein